jgi:hypothetical protein
MLSPDSIERLNNAKLRIDTIIQLCNDRGAAWQDKESDFIINSMDQMYIDFKFVKRDLTYG